MSACVIDGKQCQCQPSEGVPCVSGTPAQVQAALHADLAKALEELGHYRKTLNAFGELLKWKAKQ